MLKKIALALVLVILGFLGYVAIQPSVSTASRTATLPAPPAAVFAQINDFHKWQDWSPWAKLDPDAKTSFEGPSSGVGASFAWSGNEKVGEGKMTIAESSPDSGIKMNLDFAKPFESKSIAEFKLKPEGAGTNVTWSITGDRPFLARAMCILLRGDKMVSKMLGKGLTNLGKAASAASATPKP